jgi:peroxiredoxin
VDEIWYVAVNDAFVMGAWARSLGAGVVFGFWPTAVPTLPRPPA